MRPMNIKEVNVNNQNEIHSAHVDQLIDLGVASVETKGASMDNAIDGVVLQHRPGMGLSQD